MITVFSKANLPMERGVGRIYSQSRGRGHRKFFWGLRPQTPSGSPLLFSPPNPKCAPRSLVEPQCSVIQEGKTYTILAKEVPSLIESK